MDAGAGSRRPATNMGLGIHTLAFAAAAAGALIFHSGATPLAHAQTIPRIGTSFGEVTASGGTVRGSGFLVTVPPGAVPPGAAYSVTVVPQVPGTLPPPPAGLQLDGRPFSLLVQNAAGQPATPDQPLEVRIAFAPAQPALPQLYVLLDGQWLAIPTEVEGREIVGTYTGGAAVALFLRPIPAELPRTGASPRGPSLATGRWLAAGAALAALVALSGLLAWRVRRSPSPPGGRRG